MMPNNGAMPPAPFARFPVLSALQTLVRFQVSALVLQEPPPLALKATLLLFALHAVGFLLLGLVWERRVMVALYILVAAAGLILGRARRGTEAALFAPFWFVYVLIPARYVFIRALHGDIPGYFDYTLPDPRMLLHVEYAVAAACLYALAIGLALGLQSRARAICTLAAGGAGVILGWAVVTYFGQRTFGASGSDPYAYVQMGIDFARHGTFDHPFALFSYVAHAPLSWYPVLHVGYRLPYAAAGNAISVWAPAGSVAYALAYKLGGEAALYLVNPLFSMLGGLSAGLLAWELTRRYAQSWRVVTALAAFALAATANEVVVWAGVTMADAQALVLTTLAVYAALRLYRSGSWLWAVGAGLLWGMAYDVRHTQLVIGFALVIAIAAAPTARATRVRNLILLGASAIVVALPDLWYHQVYLGNWLRPESEELALYALSAIPATLQTIGAHALTGAEFGWLALWLLAGIFLFWRRDKVLSAVLLLWLGATLLVQIPYAALRLRDLIPQFPVLCFYVAFGMVAPIGELWVRRSEWAWLAGAALLFLTLEFGLVRVWDTLPRGILPPPPRFGAMTQAQRKAFDELAAATPAEALIGTSLNSGALDLYSERRAFRPADWSPAELKTFLQVTAPRPVYLLEDDASLERVRTAVGAAHLEEAGSFDVPLFGNTLPPHAGALWKVKREESLTK